MKKALTLVLLIAATAFTLHAQETAAPVLLASGKTGPYHLVEKSDWARYDNGKYIGHVYREVRASIQPTDSGPGTEYRGDFFVLEETLRDELRSARAIDEVVPAVFRVSPTGQLSILQDKGFPSLRGFPAFPKEAVRVGTKWVAQGTRAIDPRHEGRITAVPIIAEFEYKGIEDYKGERVHRVYAKYATRYRVASAESFTGAQGTHDVDILLQTSTGLPLLMRDRLDETFTWPDGSSIRYKGFTLTFAEGYLPPDHGEAITELREKLSGKPDEKTTPLPAGNGASEGKPASTGSGEPSRPAPQATQTPIPPPEAAPVTAGAEAPTEPGPFELAGGGTPANIDIQPTEAGIKLVVKDIHFAPDSDQFLPSEQGRLDLIAQALVKDQKRQLLVEGHTASVGRPGDEQSLSERRAKRMVDELVKRGIGAERCIYKGWGSTRPIDSNSTEAGRARNRRVEITILD